MNDQNVPDAPHPQTTATGKVVLRAFPTDTSLSGFTKRIVQEASDRLIKASRITSKLNSERPHEPSKLLQAGLSWKSNFTTRPLNTLVSRAVGRFPRAITSARYLTSSELPSEIPNSRAKTAFFRSEFTQCLRKDPRFDDFVETMASEDVTFGWCAAGWLDEDAWFPFAWRQDAIFVPAITKQISNLASAVVLKQGLLPNEAYELLLAAQNVEDGRWNRDLLAQAINKAMPETQRSQETQFSRLQEELLRGLQNSSSYAGSSTVLLYHVLAQELDGRVSHYILDGDHNVIFKHEDRFENMMSTTTFFAFEKADGTLMGSKGIGRIAYTMSSVLDRNRNDIVDRLQLSGKLIAQAKAGNHAKFKMSVIGNVIIIDDDFVLTEQKVNASPEESIVLDKYLGSLMDDMTGSMSEADFRDRERVTQAEILARLGRANEREDDFLLRWLRQFGALTSGIQYRILNPNMPSDTPGYAAAKRLMDRLLTRLTPEEIELLRNTPALTTVSGWTEMERAAIVQACIEAQGNPMYDQHAIAEAKVTAQVSPEFAEQVILKVEDPTQVAEQTRTQLFENDLLLNGQAVPVSPRDAHDIHWQALEPLLAPAVQEAMSNPSADMVIEQMLAHGQAHVDAAKAAKEVSPVMQQAEQTIQLISKAHEQAKQAEAAEQAEAEQAAAIQDAVVTPPTTDAPLPTQASPVV